MHAFEATFNMRSLIYAPFQYCYRRCLRCFWSMLFFFFFFWSVFILFIWMTLSSFRHQLNENNFIEDVPLHLGSEITSGFHLSPTLLKAIALNYGPLTNSKWQWICRMEHGHTTHKNAHTGASLYRLFITNKCVI